MGLKKGLREEMRQGPRKGMRKQHNSDARYVQNPVKAAPNLKSSSHLFNIFSGP